MTFEQIDAILDRILAESTPWEPGQPYVEIATTTSGSYTCAMVYYGLLLMQLSTDATFLRFVDVAGAETLVRADLIESITRQTLATRQRWCELLRDHDAVFGPSPDGDGEDWKS